MDMKNERIAIAVAAHNMSLYARRASKGEALSKGTCSNISSRACLYSAVSVIYFGMVFRCLFLPPALLMICDTTGAWSLPQRYAELVAL